MQPNTNYGARLRARIARAALGGLAGAGLGALLLAGCASAPAPSPVVAAAPDIIWSGPGEFSADYLWTTNRPAVGFDRPVKLVRLLVRQGRAVRAVGIDVFGATLYDLLIRTQPDGQIQTRYRQGAENIDGWLLEQVLKVMFFNAPATRRISWVKQVAGAPGEPPAVVDFRVEADAVELTLADASVSEQSDADLDFQGAP